MRTFVKQTLIAAAALAAVACGTPQRQAPRDPIGGTPRPQAAIGQPLPQASHDPIGPDDPSPQKPLTNPTPQAPTFGDSTPQKSIGNGTPQKPLFPADDNQDLTPAAQAKTVKLEDGQILAVAHVASNGEVEMADLARKNATSPEVKKFASMMWTHHRDALTKEQRLQDKSKIQSQENDVSSQIKSESDASLVALRAQSGAEFDRGYVDAQVRIHKHVLDTIDQRLVPNASSPDVKGYLQAMRATVASHLAKAETLQRKLDPTLAKALQDDKRDETKAKAVTKPAPKSPGPGKRDKRDKSEGDKDEGTPPAR